MQFLLIRGNCRRSSFFRASKHHSPRYIQLHQSALSKLRLTGNTCWIWSTYFVMARRCLYTGIMTAYRAPEYARERTLCLYCVDADKYVFYNIFIAINRIRPPRQHLLCFRQTNCCRPWGHISLETACWDVLTCASFISLAPPECTCTWASMHL